MNNNEYRINALPAKTWYQLNMNDTRLLWDDNLVPCDMDTKGCDNVCSDVNAKDYSDIENAVLTGAGKEADVLFEAGVTNTLLVNADKETNGQTLYINVNGNDKSQSGKIIVNVEDNVTFTIIENFKGESSTEGRVALRTLIDTGLNSKVRLIQVYMQPESIDVLSDTGCRLSDNASFEIVQVFVGRGSLYDGIRTELIGNNSAFTADIGYLGAKKQNIDINLISNHIGKKTNSGIRVDGALKDEASKLFRGSIDFKNGSSGSVGAETENVLLLGEDVRNKTIPLILCAEEDVNGSHGATIGELDEETLFYYASRGIDKKNAEDIMTKGRIEVIIRKINDEDTEKLAEEQLEEVLQTMMWSWEEKRQPGLEEKHF